MHGFHVKKTTDLQTRTRSGRPGARVHVRRRRGLRLTWTVAVVTTVLMGGCRSELRGAPSTSERAAKKTRATSAEVAAPGLRTPNHDPSGAGNQPDWDGMARALRASVGPELTVRAGAPMGPLCETMMRDALAFYAEVDGGKDASAGTSVAILRETLDADRAACEAELSPQAAQCVSLELARRRAEFPWLVDQCARAFPRSGAASNRGASQPDAP